MATAQPAGQQRNAFGRDHGNYATVATMPNGSGNVLPSASVPYNLEVGDRCYLTGGPEYVCLNPGTSAGGNAQWVPQPVPAAVSPALDLSTAARTLAQFTHCIYEPTASRTIDIPGTGATAWDITKSATIKVYKDTRALFGVTLDVTTNGGGLWTTPAGLNQDFLLPSSSDQLCGYWEVIIDGPNKTVRVVSGLRGCMEPMIAAPSGGGGATLDLFAGGTYTYGGTTGAGGAYTYQTGAPRSDGAAFITAGAAARRIENRGDGLGNMLLLETTRTNFALQSQSLYAAAVIVAPWVAIGGTTGLGGQAGSPMGDATVTNLIFTASAADGIRQPMTGTANQQDATCCLSSWFRCTAGAEKVRLQILRKDGTLVTSPDLTLSTTWARFDISSWPGGGAQPSAGTEEIRIINASDALARTVQVWGVQYEAIATTSQVLSPSSYIKTVAVTVVRGAEQFSYNQAAVPAVFATRGMSIQWAPDSSSDELWKQGTQAGNGGPIIGFGAMLAGTLGRDGFGFVNPNSLGNDAQYAGGAARLLVTCSDGYRLQSVVSSSQNLQMCFGPPMTFARYGMLTLTAEAYRGAGRVQGALTGNGRFSMGGGPWTWPYNAETTLWIGGFYNSVVQCSGRWGQFITEA